MRTLISVSAAILLLLLFTIVPALAQEGPDEQESNDTMALSDVIDGFEIEGEIGARDDDVDWFVLQGQEGFWPEITLTYDDEDCDIDLTVFSDENIVGTLSSTSSPDSDVFNVEGVCYLKVEAFSGRGEYLIEIVPTEEDDSGTPNRDRDRRRNDDCAGPDEIEPNDDWDVADIIEGDRGSLYIEGYACVDDYDWFVLDGTEGTRPTITFYYDSEVCDLDLEVWSDDEFIGELTSTDSPDSDTFRVPGECFILVYSYDGEGEYEVEIEPSRER